MPDLFSDRPFLSVIYQENAVNLLEDTADFVSSQLSTGTTDPGVLQDVGASLLHGISNVMTAASSEAEDDGEKEEEEEFGDEDDEEKTEKKKPNKGKVMSLILYFITMYFKRWPLISSPLKNTCNLLSSFSLCDACNIT